MSIQGRLAACGGDIWASKGCVALWFWPAVVWRMWHWRFTEDDYRCFTKHLKPGDILLSKCQPFPLSNFFISGTGFKHLGVYTGPVQGIKDRKTGFINSPSSLGAGHIHTGKAHVNHFERTITHAISEGVVCQDILRVTNHVDYMVAVRPWKTAQEQSKITVEALNQVGLGYNFDFTPEGPREFYCTELGAHCIGAADIPLPQTVQKSVSMLGKKGPVYLADSFIASYKPVCCSVSALLEPALSQSSSFGDTIRQKLRNAEHAGV